MILDSERLTEKEIIALLRKNDAYAWEHIYELYAGAMYGLIWKLMENKLRADEVFLNTFLALKSNRILDNVQQALLPVILRYTYAHASQQLKDMNLTVAALNTAKGVEIIHLLTTKCSSLAEAAEYLAIPIDDARKQLQDEFSDLRKQKYMPLKIEDLDRMHMERMLRS